MATAAKPGIRAQRKAETRARILAQAALLFADLGYDGTTMEHVAEAAEVSKGTIFYIFASKSALFEALLEHSATVFRDDLVAAREGHRGWDALVCAARTIAGRIDAHPAIAQILLVEFVRRGRPWAQATAQARALMLEPLIVIVGEVAEDRVASGASGQRPCPAQLETVAVAMLGALTLTTLDRAATGSERNLSDVLAGLTLALSGLRP